MGKASLVPVIIIGVSQRRPRQRRRHPGDHRLALDAKKVQDVAFVQYVGTSANGRVVQLLVEASIAGFSPGPSVDVVNGLTAAFAKADAPPRDPVPPRRVVATNVAQQKESNSTGNKTQLLSILSIIVLLLFVFCSLLAPLVTLLPAVIVLQLSGSLIGELGSHGLKISLYDPAAPDRPHPRSRERLGLFLVFRVREGLRSGLAANDAVALAVARVGESISASAGTVILALLTLFSPVSGSTTISASRSRSDRRDARAG